MPFDFRRLQVLLAVAALAAFGGVLAHEGAHVEHADACVVCHAVQRTPVTLKAAAVFAFAVFCLFRLQDAAGAPRAERTLPVLRGRAPPALSA